MIGDIQGPVLECDLNNTRRKSKTKGSLLKSLREKKKISRTHLSKLSQLSVYQIEGLEGPNAENLLNKFLACTKALGYKTDDVLSIMTKVCEDSGTGLFKGVFDKPLYKKTFGEGARLYTHLDQNGNFLGLLELQTGHSLEMKQIHKGDLIVGIVREGTLVIDHLTEQSVHQKDSFFLLPAKRPAKFLNEDGFMRTAAIFLFSIRFPTD